MTRLDTPEEQRIARDSRNVWVSAAVVIGGSVLFGAVIALLERCSS